MLSLKTLTGVLEHVQGTLPADMWSANNLLKSWDWLNSQ